MDPIITLIKRIDLPTMHAIIGSVILKAVKSLDIGSDETALAEILVLKYGTLIFNDKRIRLSLLDSLSIEEAATLAGKCGIATDRTHKVYNELSSYFGSAYDADKSKTLVDFLGLGAEYYFKKAVDLRGPKETIRAEFGEYVSILSYLHDYQKRVKDEIMVRLNQKTEKSFFVQMPTGAGKTYTALECAVDLMRKPCELGENRKPALSKYIVWLVDRNELAEQALESFKRLWKIRGEHEVNVYRLFKDFDPQFRQENGGFVFSGFDKFYSVLKNEKHKSYESVKHLIENTELLIIDEAHHSLADTYFECIERFKQTPFVKIVGLSATPGTSDRETTRQLVELYSGDRISIRDKEWNPVDNSIEFLQHGGYLAFLKTQLLETGITSSANSEDEILDDLAANTERNQKILEQIVLADSKNESTVVFACNIDHVYALLVLCRASDIKAEYIIGEVDQAERIGILAGFKQKEYNILLNLDILSTGIDLPNIEKVIIAKPIRSANLISQILGRALRGPKNGGNASNTIINIKDNLINFPGASFLYNYYQNDWEKI